jgi:hypothetical protein
VKDKESPLFNLRLSKGFFMNINQYVRGLLKFSAEGQTKFANIPNGTVTLYHGSDLKSLNSILEKGVSAKRIQRISGGSESFWLVSDKDVASAWMFAQVNPTGSESYGIMEFQVPAMELQQAIQNGSVIRDDKNWVGEGASMVVYQFKPQAFGLLNKSTKKIITKKEVQKPEVQPKPQVAPVKEEPQMELAMGVARIYISGIDSSRIKTAGTVIDNVVYFSNSSEHWKNHLALLVQQLEKQGAKIEKIETNQPAVE